MTDENGIGVAPGRRQWRKGDRAKISIMQIFRSAFRDHDARRATQQVAGAETVISARSRQRREGMSEDALRHHLQADLSALLNTIRLDAIVSMTDAPHVATSIINYGFRDLSGISTSELGTPAVVDSIRQSLLDHEPRLVPGSLEVRVIAAEDSTTQRLSISVTAELMGDPVDIPLDFDAEVDLGAGKLMMKRLRVQM